MDSNRFSKTYSGMRNMPVTLINDGPQGPEGPVGVTDCTNIIRAMGITAADRFDYADVVCSTFAAGDVVAFVVKQAVNQLPIPPPYVIEPNYGTGFRIKFSSRDSNTYVWMVITASPYVQG